MPNFLSRAAADLEGDNVHGKTINGIELISEAEVRITIGGTIPGDDEAFMRLMLQGLIPGPELSSDEFSTLYHIRSNPGSPPQPRQESGYLIPRDGQDLPLAFFRGATGQIISLVASIPSSSATGRSRLTSLSTP